MKRWKTRRSSLWVMTVLVFIILGVAGIGLYIYMAYMVPHQKLNSWLLTTGVTELSQMDRTEIREVCHQVISHRLGNHHDAFLALEQVGNHESIPLLIRASSWHPVNPDGLTICTSNHCQDALKKITGYTEAVTTEQWESWWEQNRKEFK